MIESADTALREAQAALTGLDDPSASVGAATEEEVKAGRALKELELEHKAESELVHRAQEAASAAAKSVAAFNKELEVRGEGTARQDLETLRGDVEKAQSEHDQLPHVEAVDEEQLEKAAAIQKQTRKQLSQAEGLQRNLQGRLEATGGAVLDERIAAQEEMVQRAQHSHEALEEKYEGERELYDTLSRLDESRTAHLGRLLAKPVGTAVHAAGGRALRDFELDASLTASGVQPLDYLTPDELALPPRAVDWDAGDVTAIDVEAAVG